jgi:hypothetical protein
MTGWQLGARYLFVRYRWGINETAEEIFKTVTTSVNGLMPFFRRAEYAQIGNYSECLSRLQMIEGLFALVGFSPYPPDTKSVTPVGARLFVKRAWLRPGDFQWQVRMLWDGDSIREIPDLIQGLREQGGELAASVILAYLNSLSDDALHRIPNGAELKISVGESVPQPTAAKVKAVLEPKFKELDNFYKGQQYEKLYWQNQDAGLEQRILLNYSVSGGFKSARRFYSQARRNFRDPVTFSNGGGLYIFMLGLCSNDQALRKQALEDSRSGSFNDMMMNIWDAAVRDLPAELETNVKELIERYEQNQGSDSLGRRLQRFLPLLPALRDVKHSGHREALEYFGKEGGWTILRFIWIEKFKMPTEEAITFLGGRENNALALAIIYYLEKDQSNMLDALNKVFKLNTFRQEQRVFAACLYDRIHPLTLPEDAVDLKPPGATSITEAVLDRIDAGRKGKR